MGSGANPDIERFNDPDPDPTHLRQSHNIDKIVHDEYC
jgi:hypothetical protein